QQAMPLSDIAEKAARAGSAFAYNASGVRVGEERALAAKAELDGRIWFGMPGHVGERGRFGLSHTRENDFEPEAGGVGTRFAETLSALSPGDDLALVGEQDAGEGEYQDDKTGGAASGEMKPEKDATDSHGLGTQSQALGVSPAAEKIVIDAGELDSR